MTTAQPAVSVVVPVYNAASFLDETLNALRNQTLRDLEIIVVDDGSKDDSRRIAERHATEDPRVRVIAQANAGVHEARNNGIREARAELIALSDADDVSLPERLERQIAFMRANPDVGALGTHGWRIGEDGRELGVFDVGPLDREHFARLRAANEPIYLLTSSAVFPKRIALALGGFRRFDGMAEDLDFWTRISDEHPVLTLPERLVRYRVHARSASTTRFYRQQEDTLLIRENTLKRRRGQPELTAHAYHQILESEPIVRRRRRLRQWRSRYYYRVAGGLLANGKPSGAAYLALSILADPTIVVERARQQVLPWIRSRMR